MCLAADRHHCFFRDPNVDWNANLVKDPLTGISTFSSEKHRKIRLYVERADDIDNNGHGTHTMGSMVGNPLDTSNVNLSDYRCASSTLHVLIICQVNTFPMFTVSFIQAYRTGTLATYTASIALKLVVSICVLVITH